MTKPIIREHNATTNEIIDREMTDAEFESFTAAKTAAEAVIAAEQAKAAEKAELLAQLGITEDQAKLLLS